jgi:hypothetical protein
MLAGNDQYVRSYTAKRAYLINMSGRISSILRAEGIAGYGSSQILSRLWKIYFRPLKIEGKYSSEKGGEFFIAFSRIDFSVEVVSGFSHSFAVPRIIASLPENCPRVPDPIEADHLTGNKNDLRRTVGIARGIIEHDCARIRVANDPVVGRPR